MTTLPSHLLVAHACEEPSTSWGVSQCVSSVRPSLVATSQRGSRAASRAALPPQSIVRVPRLPRLSIARLARARILETWARRTRMLASLRHPRTSSLLCLERWEGATLPVSVRAPPLVAIPFAFVVLDRIPFLLPWCPWPSPSPYPPSPWSSPPSPGNYSALSFDPPQSPR